MRYDVIVLGLGAAGSATLYQLAKRGAKVLGIDQYAPPHVHGSTHGDTRITRLAIGEGAHYVPLAKRAHEIWREIEAETGTSLLTTNGGLILSGATTAATYHGTPFFKNTLAAAKTFDIPHELMDAAAIRARFPQFAAEDDAVGYYEPSAGFVRPEVGVAAQLHLSRRLGANAIQARALSFDATPNGVAIKTDNGNYEADQLVVSAGPWLPQLLDAKLARRFKVYRQVQLWFDVEDTAAFTPDVFPIFIWDLPQRKGGVYGFPAINGPQGGIKVATEQFTTTTTPDAIQRDVTPAEIQEMFDGFIAPYVRGVTAKCLRAATCLYTVTQDFGFVIDRHPQYSRVIIASPCSGHGFKHSAAVGEALAEWTLTGQTRFDLEPFRMARLADPQP